MVRRPRGAMLIVSAVLHAALIAWFILQQPHPASLAGVPDQPFEILFEPAVAPEPSASPALPSPEAATELQAEPAAPEAAAAPPPETVTPAPPDALPAETAVPAPVRPTPNPALPAVAPPATTVAPAVRPAKARPAAPRPAPAAAPANTAPAASAAPPPAVAAQASAPAAAADLGWRSALHRWMASHKHYPERARQRGDEGTVVLRITVDPTGRVLDVAVARSSGSPILDDAARDMMAGQRVPPFLPGMMQAQLTTSVPIRFVLEE